MRSRAEGDKRYVQGTHRVEDPSETLARLWPTLDCLGITRVADITGLDYIGIPVAVSIRPEARGLSVQQGKGLTLAAAKVSAIMESVESYSAQSHRHPTVWRSPAQLVSGSHVLPRHLLRRRLTRTTPIPWIEAHDVLRERAVLVPEELVTTDFSWPLPQGHGWFLASSNGLAAGNTLQEAQLHAICELVERDALTLWRHRAPEARAGTRIALNEIDDPYADQLLRRYRAASISVALWDTTSDIGIPSCFCMIDDQKGRPPFLGSFAGGGCHPSAGVAMCRALAEAAQSRLAFIHGAREDLPFERYFLIGWHESLGALLATWNDAAGTRCPIQTSSFARSSMGADLDEVLRRLGRAGIDSVAMVDLTDPQIGIPCVRVVIAALEGMHRHSGLRAGPRLRRMSCR
ncbi:YcaO-like family protein [Microvirga rosea]|uniref:YcaO-like family protein n=1 Tax=Microvirga rosea TaxID=2715425 RepID=UPI001D0B5AA2|nr:YcaO-like family protein [Microvirga rosea]MCB8819545.1 YcaO-like family protein [Microvirga rosea]